MNANSTRVLGGQGTYPEGGVGCWVVGGSLHETKSSITHEMTRDHSGRTPSTLLIATCEALEVAARAAIEREVRARGDHGALCDECESGQACVSAYVYDAAIYGYYGRLEGIQRVFEVMRGDTGGLTPDELAALARVKRTEKGGYRFR